MPNILVIDDDPVQMIIMVKVAEDMGGTVFRAADFEEGEAQLRDHPFDVVLVDLSLGERDGIELLRLIASLRKIPKVIIVSGYEQRILSATVRMARGSGIVDAVSLSKPLDLHLLRRELNTVREKPALAYSGGTAAIVNEHDIALALSRGDFFPAFQPKIALGTGEIEGCEVLARWISPMLGSVSPADFIPVAERSGQIGAITEAVLSQALTSLRKITRRFPNFRMGMNLSAAMLSDLSIPEQIEAMIAAAGVSGESLIMEVTESVAMADVVLASDILVRLRLKGMGLAIDDFGTGYSSLAALARMPFTELKIDQSFVKLCGEDRDVRKVVRASVAMAHELQMKTVAEGIEDAATCEWLTGIGCDTGQGFYFSAALPYGDLIPWMESDTRSRGDRQAGAQAIGVSAA